MRGSFKLAKSTKGQSTFPFPSSVTLSLLLHPLNDWMLEGSFTVLVVKEGVQGN
jgi:hypothetical protein